MELAVFVQILQGNIIMYVVETYHISIENSTYTSKDDLHTLQLQLLGPTPPIFLSSMTVIFNRLDKQQNRGKV
jgi:hypothetical protein